MTTELKPSILTGVGHGHAVRDGLASFGGYFKGLAIGLFPSDPEAKAKAEAERVARKAEKEKAKAERRAADEVRMRELMELAKKSA